MSEKVSGFSLSRIVLSLSLSLSKLCLDSNPFMNGSFVLYLPILSLGSTSMVLLHTIMVTA